MSIRVHCENCGNEHDAPDFLTGKTLPCPSCREPLTVPFDDILHALLTEEAESQGEPGASGEGQPARGLLGKHIPTIPRLPEGVSTDKPDLPPTPTASNRQTASAGTLPPLPASLEQSIEDSEEEVDQQGDEDTTEADGSQQWAGVPLGWIAGGGVLAAGLIVGAVVLVMSFSGKRAQDNRGDGQVAEQPVNPNDPSTIPPSTPAEQPPQASDEPQDPADVTEEPVAATSAEVILNARQALKEGELAALHEQIAAATTRDPDNPDLQYWMGMSLLDAGSPFEAMRHVAKAIEHDDTNHLYLVLRARIYLVEDIVAVAQKDLERAISFNPESLEATFLLGRVFDRQQQLNEAIEQYSRALRLNPLHAASYVYRSVAHFTLAEDEKALADIRRALSLGAANSILYACRGQILFEQQKYVEAIGSLTEALELEPEDSQSLAFRAAARLQLDQPSEAILADLDQAIELDPDNAFSRRWRAELNLKTGHLAEGLVDIDRALEIEPDNFSLHRLRGFIHNASNDVDLAVDDFTRAIDLAPKVPDLYFFRGQLYRQLSDATDEGNQQQLALALEDFGHALQLIPDTRNKAWAERAEVLSALESSFEPAKAMTLCRQGKLAYAAGEDESALDLFESAVKADPGFTWAHNNLAYLRATSLNPEVRDSKAAMSAAVDLVRRAGTEHHCFLGTLVYVYSASGDWNGAKVFADKALKNCPDELRDYYQSILESVRNERIPRPQDDTYSHIQ